MDGGFHAIIHLNIQFWQLIFLIGGGIFDIPQGRCVHNVSNNKSLDGLILGNGFSSGDTSDALSVATSVLVATVISSLYRHAAVDIGMKRQRKIFQVRILSLISTLKIYQAKHRIDNGQTIVEEIDSTDSTMSNIHQQIQ
jgi:hypothetical protein